MSPSGNALPPVADLQDVDAQLIAEFGQLVRDVSAEVAREAVVPNLKQALTGVTEANSRTVNRIEEKVRTLLEEDRKLLQENLQQPVREIVAAYEGAQHTLAALASSSRLLEILELLPVRLEQLREASEELERQHEESERLAQEKARSLEAAISALERRIPDAARVIDETSKQRDTLLEISKETRELTAKARQLVDQLKKDLEDVQEASAALRFACDQITALREEVQSLRQQVAGVTSSVEQALVNLLAETDRKAEERSEVLAGLLREVEPSIIKALETTGARIAHEFERHVTHLPKHWTQALEEVQSALEELEASQRDTRKQLSILEIGSLALLILVVTLVRSYLGLF